MRIGFGPAGERAPDEVAYTAQGGDPYRVKVARADSCGGWIATPSDLVRFVTHVDGLSDTPNILRPETIKVMTTPSALNPKYAKGWIVNGQRLVAQRQPAGHVGGDGARAERFVLGRTRQYAAARSTERRRPQPCGRADGARGEELECLTQECLRQT